MKTKAFLSCALIGASVMTGCVSLEKTKTQMSSANALDKKAAIENSCDIAIDGKANLRKADLGFANPVGPFVLPFTVLADPFTSSFTVEERCQFLDLIAKEQEALIGVIDSRFKTLLYNEKQYGDKNWPKDEVFLKALSLADFNNKKVRDNEVFKEITRSYYTNHYDGTKIASDKLFRIVKTFVNKTDDWKFLEEIAKKRPDICNQEKDKNPIGYACWERIIPTLIMPTLTTTAAKYKFIVQDTVPLSLREKVLKKNADDYVLLVKVLERPEQRSEEDLLYKSADDCMTNEQKIAEFFPEAGVYVRGLMVRKLTNQKLIADLLKTFDFQNAFLEHRNFYEWNKFHLETSIITEMIGKITDEKLIVDLLKTVNFNRFLYQGSGVKQDTKLVAEAIESMTGKLTDEKLIADLLKTVVFQDVGRGAIENMIGKLTDEKLIADVAFNAKSDLTRKTALAKVPAATIVEYAKTAPIEKLAELIENTTDQNLLAVCVMRAPKANVGSLVHKITDTKMADELFKKTSFEGYGSDYAFTILNVLLGKLSPELTKELLDQALQHAKEQKGKTIVIDGFYVNMPVLDYLVISQAHGFETKCSITKPTSDWKTTWQVTQMEFDKNERYKLFECDDDEQQFVVKFIAKYCEGREDAIAMSDLEQMGYINKIKYKRLDGDESYSYWRMYSSQKFRVQLRFSDDNGTMVFERY